MVEIIRARPEAAAQLSAMAWAAKGHWGYPETWMKQWRDLLTISPNFIAQNDTFVAYIDRQPAGFHALVEDADGLSLEHLWVMPEFIGQGIGRALFEDAARRAAARGALSLTITADPHAEAFYLHLGARRAGSIASEVAGFRRELPLLVFDLAKHGRQTHPAR